MKYAQFVSFKVVNCILFCVDLLETLSFEKLTKFWTVLKMPILLFAKSLLLNSKTMVLESDFEYIYLLESNFEAEA